MIMMMMMVVVVVVVVVVEMMMMIMMMMMVVVMMIIDDVMADMTGHNVKIVIMTVMMMISTDLATVITNLKNALSGNRSDGRTQETIRREICPKRRTAKEGRNA